MKAVKTEGSPREKAAGKRKEYTAEFKRSAAQLVLQSGQTLEAASKDLGVSIGSLQSWVTEIKRYGADAFPGKGKLHSEDQRIRDLEQKVKRLRMERDILKKAMAYFMEPPK